jgi:hypothetical protein
MAGSASVTPMPRSSVMTSTTGSGALRGRVAPITRPKGMSPRLSPSMKNMSPTMTASSPPVTTQESSTSWRRMKSWNNTR